MSEEERDVESMTPGECEREIEETYANPDHPYFNKESYLYGRANARMESLFKKKHPSDTSVPSHQRGLDMRLTEEGVTIEDIERAEEKLEEEVNRDYELTPEENEALNELREQWGQDFDKNVKQAIAGFGSFVNTLEERFGKDFAEKIKQFVEGSRLGNDPETIAIFKEIGKTE